MRQDENYAVHTRNRIIDWQDHGAVRAQADGLSVLDTMRAIRDGRLPPPLIARLLGFHYVGAEPGEIVIELQSGQSLENSAETLHTGVAAAMLDTAMSAAAGTLLTINKGAVTLDLKITYLKPLTIESGPIRAIGRVVDLAEPTAFVTGQIHNGEGSLAVHAIGVVSAITSKQTLSSVPRAVSSKPESGQQSGAPWRRCLSERPFYSVSSLVKPRRNVFSFVAVWSYDDTRTSPASRNDGVHGSGSR